MYKSKWSCCRCIRELFPSICFEAEEERTTERLERVYACSTRFTRGKHQIFLIYQGDIQFNSIQSLRTVGITPAQLWSCLLIRILRLSIMRLFLLLLQLASIAQANTEKTIFVAPSSISLPNVHPGLDNLCLDVVSPNNSLLHVQLPVAFPNDEAPRGIQSWYLLDRLQPGQRYELRLCWQDGLSRPSEYWARLWIRSGVSNVLVRV